MPSTHITFPITSCRVFPASVNFDQRSHLKFMAANLRTESPNGYLNLFNSCTGSSLTVLCVKQSRNSCIQFHIFGMKIWYESIGYFGHAAVCMCIGYVHAKMNSHKRGIASLFKIGCDIVQSSDVVSNYTYDILFIISFNWYYMEIRCNIFWFSQFQRCVHGLAMCAGTPPHTRIRGGCVCVVLVCLGSTTLLILMRSHYHHFINLF